MGRPKATLKYCPSCKAPRSRRRIYERNEKKQNPIGWRCSSCGGVWIDEEPTRMR